MGKLSQASRYSTHLFALPSFAESFRRVLDLVGATSELNLLGEVGEAEEAADLSAIAADWAAVGADLWAALGAEASREDLAALALLAAVLEELG
jgi:hypothetical protein